MIVIINYGAGNIMSVLNMLHKLGADAKISSDRDDIEIADKLILPGVGAFDAGMENLEEKNLVPAIEEAVLVKKKLILGICLGAQLLGRGSQEGRKDGLGLVPMDIIRFSKMEGRKIPHMGWNHVSLCREHWIMKNLGADARFYFVHSYYMKPDNQQTNLLTCNYLEDFTAAISFENIIGVQFHPEKSHKYGLELLRNFVEI